MSQTTIEKGSQLSSDRHVPTAEELERLVEHTGAQVDIGHIATVSTGVNEHHIPDLTPGMRQLSGKPYPTPARVPGRKHHHTPPVDPFNLHNKYWGHD